jgi:tRNA 2-selenouridine synthase
MNISEIYEKDWDQENYIIIDVRSPQEYADDHIIGSINLPVLYDEEYELIGRIYKEKSAFEANKTGAQLVMKNISTHLGCSLKEYDKRKKLIFYCKRGGNRSFSFFTVCGKIGWKCGVISGGYKSYRKFVIERIEKLSQCNEFIIISGRTGNGKTRILNLLELKGLQVIDLEGLACHRGSILGSYTDKPQPTQKHFESKIFETIRKCQFNQIVFVESESRKIGNLSIPDQFFSSIYNSRLIKIENSLKHRVDFLIREYPNLMEDQAAIFDLVNLLRKRIPKEDILRIEKYITNREFKKLASNLLSIHYDKSYDKSMLQRIGKFVKQFNLDCGVEDAADSVCRYVIDNNIYKRENF